VGVQVGADQRLLNLIPLLIKPSRLGILGFITPSVKPGVASRPRSSAIMNRILGRLGRTGVGTSSDTLQDSKFRIAKRRINDLFMDIGQRKVSDFSNS
jgi:hypothetical protein